MLEASIELLLNVEAAHNAPDWLLTLRLDWGTEHGTTKFVTVHVLGGTED